MPRLALTCGASAALALLACGCPGSKAPDPKLKLEDLLARIAATRDQVTSFSAETVMDYWWNDQRTKGTVLAMGTTGARIRINALSPAGNAPIADLACNGESYQSLDLQKNCYLDGQCTKDTIAQLFHVALAPDDFVQLAVGATPVIAGATGTVTWDGKKKQETLRLDGDGGRKQVIVLDATDNRADVVSSEVTDAGGKQEWRIDNTDFHDVKDQAGMARRVPGKSRFRTPGEHADLLVEWKEIRLGLPLDDGKFLMTIEEGTPRCQ